MRRDWLPVLVCVLAGVCVPRCLSAQSGAATPAVVREVGSGDETFVLICGIVGGVHGFARLASALVTQGYHVVIVDPYAMSIDSADVSFTAMARRVDRVLDDLHVTKAHVVGHSHGAGVAQRLAAFFPQRVRDLAFLDAGAFARAQSANMSASVKLAPYLARLPGGRTVIRRRLASGLREHSGHPDWLDAESERAYVDPVVDNIDRATAMAGRLSVTREAEDVGTLIGRLRVPVVVVLGEFPHTSGPDSSDVVALRPLGALLHVERLRGIGHFPHEEAPDVVAHILMTPRVVASAAAR